MGEGGAPPPINFIVFFLMGGGGAPINFYSFCSEISHICRSLTVIDLLLQFSESKMAAQNKILCCLVVVILGLGIYDVLTNFESNRCAMSFMWETPEYIVSILL